MITNLVKAALTVLVLTNIPTINIAKATIIQEYYVYNNPVVEIPKIKLKKELFPNNKTKNTVEKNIEVIEGSKMPTEKDSNLILASHSGTSKIAYFKHLDELTQNDIVYIYYQKVKYKYVIADIYDVAKTGFVEIKRIKSKKAITLITCKKSSNLQTVYIGYLETIEQLHK